MNTTLIQKEEQQMREAYALAHQDNDPVKILKAVSRHHCIPVMSKRAGDFRRRFKQGEWLLDVGCGTGYYWRNTYGAKLILIDFAINNLKAAKRLLRDQKDVVFIQADAAHLPLKADLISGIWSVQATQHFPDTVMRLFLKELKRVLKNKFTIQVYSLNPARLHKFLYRLLRKEFFIRGRGTNNLVLNRFSACELAEVWSILIREGRYKIGFSELFFHPDFNLCPQAKVLVFIEQCFLGLPGLAGLFARQIQIEIFSQP